jgi:hypothetical protein
MALLLSVATADARAHLARASERSLQERNQVLGMAIM